MPGENKHEWKKKEKAKEKGYQLSKSCEGKKIKKVKKKPRKDSFHYYYWRLTSGRGGCSRP